MTAKVKEVAAYQAIDGEVFDTYIKAHHRNIWVLLGRLLGDDPYFDDSSRPIERARELLHARLTNTTQSQNLAPKQALFDLAEELK